MKSFSTKLETIGHPIYPFVRLPWLRFTMANKLIAVTHNVKEFKRVLNLEVEDWAKDSSR